MNKKHSDGYPPQVGNNDGDPTQVSNSIGDPPQGRNSPGRSSINQRFRSVSGPDPTVLSLTYLNQGLIFCRKVSRK
jgi:hypothetical protein